MFSQAVPSRRLRPLDDAAAYATAQAAVARFAAAFPDIRFDVAWHSDSLNAQAYRLGPRRHVRVYGGLARHEAIALEGLALALAHEVGHHEGGPPFSRWYDWMSTDRRADEWAATTGVPAVFGHDAARRILEEGGRQLLSVLAETIVAQGAAAAACSDEQPCLRCRARMFGVADPMLPASSPGCGARGRQATVPS